MISYSYRLYLVSLYVYVRSRKQIDFFVLKRYDMLSELAECTMLMLNVIHEMYRTRRITYKEFLDHTNKKLQFLYENIENISSESERKNASEILSKCTAVLSEPDLRYSL
jgi:restriction endonuclease